MEVLKEKYIELVGKYDGVTDRYISLADKYIELKDKYQDQSRRLIAAEETRDRYYKNWSDMSQLFSQLVGSKTRGSKLDIMEELAATQKYKKYIETVREIKKHRFLTVIVELIIGKLD